jgi:capsular exopolysaccharide synthesis family protein
METEEPITRKRGSTLRGLSRFKVLILVLTIALPVLSIAYDLQKTKMYSATTEIQLLSQNRSDSGAIIALSAADIATAQQVAMSTKVQNIVSARTHSKPPPVVVTQAGISNTLNFTVSAKSGVAAALYSNTYATAFLDYTKLAYVKGNLAQQQVLERKKADIEATINDLEAQLVTATINKSPNITSLNAQLQAASAELQAVSNSRTSLSVALAEVSSAGTVTTRATVPTSPSSPKIVTDALVALVLGALLGCVIAIGLTFIDDRIRDTATLKELVDPSPVIGEVPIFKTAEQPKVRRGRAKVLMPVVAAAEPQSQAAEAYRSLRTAVQFLGVDSPGCRVVQVTSPGTDEGKTTTVTNLAVLLSQVGMRVVLVSADLRRPTTDRFFKLPTAVGLSTVLAGTTPLADAITPIEEFPGLSVIAAGPVPPNPSELVSSKKMSFVIDSLRQSFDIVLIDTAPLLPVPDAVDSAQYVDVLVLIVKCGSTRGRDVKEALNRLSAVDVAPAGVVFNAVPSPTALERYLYRRGYGSYGYGYLSYSGYRGYSGYSSKPSPAEEAQDEGETSSLT